MLHLNGLGRAWFEESKSAETRRMLRGRDLSTAQPNHLAGSEMGRESWVASVGMTGGDGGHWWIGSGLSWAVDVGVGAEGPGRGPASTWVGCGADVPVGRAATTR